MRCSTSLLLLFSLVLCACAPTPRPVEKLGCEFPPSEDNVKRTAISFWAELFSLDLSGFESKADSLGCSVKLTLTKSFSTFDTSYTVVAHSNGINYAFIDSRLVFTVDDGGGAWAKQSEAYPLEE